MQKTRDLSLEEITERTRETIFEFKCEIAFEGAKKSMQEGYREGMMGSTKEMALWTATRLGYYDRLWQNQQGHRTYAGV